MVLIKHNSLKSDIFFNPIFFPGFSGSRFFKVRVQVLEVTISAWVFSCKFAAYIQNTFSQQHFWTAASDRSSFIRVSRNVHELFMYTNQSVSSEVHSGRCQTFKFVPSILKFWIPFCTFHRFRYYCSMWNFVNSLS